MEIDLNNLVGLDFETYGGTSLPDYGLYNYVTCSTFTPLIAAVADVHAGDFYYETIDFTGDFEAQVERLGRLLEDKTIVAHNAGFEQMVLRAIGIEIPSSRFVDSAVLARAAGAAGKLEAAAPQLLNTDKLEDGRRLIRLFSIPGKYQEANDSLLFDSAIVLDHPDEWELFKKYCRIDAKLGLAIARQVLPTLPEHELENQTITMDMNFTGWPVDVATVQEMQRRYLENQAEALVVFRDRHDAHELNLGSLKQLKEWCLDRGIKASSFDEKNVAKLIERINKKLDTMEPSDLKYENYCEVLDLLYTKQILGGSSLKKLQVILDTTGKDGRLRDQYLHVGAGQTYRTSGRGVQMQNLKRLGADVADMEELADLDITWDNEKLAANLRQCFTSSDPDGALIVGDFSSVESRGLAWLAGAADKLKAFRQGLDVYKVGAAKQFGVAYEAVTKPQRQFGKVGELSCGYQAGAGAVQSFAEGMGVALTEGEAAQIVFGWRDANPEVVELWAKLDQMLDDLLERKQSVSIRVGPSGEYSLTGYHIATPQSLHNQHPGAQSIALQLLNEHGRVVMHRVIHGLYRRGRDICYYKPSELKSGDVWKNHFTDPKTKQVRFFNIYGGKLSGILTQSFCREIFFEVLRKVHAWAGALENVALVGQFHDEIVLDWVPDPTGNYDVGRGWISLPGAQTGLSALMSRCTVPGFPLVAEVKYDYRYTK